MPWCPKCRVEYRDGFSICSDCHENLVDELEPLKEPQYEPEAFLVSVPTAHQADLLESLLNSEDIPVMRRIKGAGGYLQIFMGMSHENIDLYVPSSALSRSEELIAVHTAAQAQEQIPEGPDEPQDELSGVFTDQNRARRIWMLMAMLLILWGVLRLAIR